MAQLGEWVSISEAVRLSGLSTRTLKRMEKEGRLKFSRSPGGHVRIARGELDGLLRHSASAPMPSSSVLQSRKERVRELDLSTLRKFRASWKNENFSAQKKLESLRTFFRFAQANGWIVENPAVKLESQKTRRPQVLPFAREEWLRILAACDAYGDNYGRTGQENARRLRALVLLLRYSGLRIGDVVSLPRERIAGGKLFLYTAKTGTPVWCPLHDAVIQALDAVRGTSEKYFFWTGQGKLKSAVGDWQRSLKKLFVLAGVTCGHPHRFRHTFAVELLLAGVPIERVSVLLGHSSTRITEKHYSAWVRARQEQLEADVRRSWALESNFDSSHFGVGVAVGKDGAVN